MKRLAFSSASGIVSSLELTLLSKGGSQTTLTNPSVS